MHAFISIALFTPMLNAAAHSNDHSPFFGTTATTTQPTGTAKHMYAPNKKKTPLKIKETIDIEVFVHELKSALYTQRTTNRPTERAKEKKRPFDSAHTEIM